ncbi:dipeptidase [Anaerobranca gottschalkii]|uniref:Dipeptidase. Metallo peptidase. MEROPS family M19 n=1 Tax=Anaerobranca gottschalkii DSM 13577 TaxID=1120990 RepID=A0A1H9Z967_9FIRM|nr:dipeptidase [Anaerobranca gottschalkii]SES77413.1 dipeptidase. Metallo peptidase. MEROPS family M19 [Anaerobranca gottschalkii DSM 13577]
MEDLKIIDGHCDTLLLFDNKDYNFHKKNNMGHIDLERLISANVLLQFFAIYIDPHYLNQALEKGLTMVSKLLQSINSDDRLFLVINKSTLSNLTPGKVGAVISLEGGEVFNRNLHLIDIFYQLGVRAIGLTWNYSNLLCDGIGEPRGGGLTIFGKEVVKRMSELGMILDVSHISVKGFWDCIEHFSHPILASHSNVKKLCNHQRNLSDDQIKEIAKTGGLIGVNFVPYHLTDQPEEASIDHIIDHISYIGDLVGIEYVGLGSDFDGVDILPHGIRDVRDLSKILQRMKERGFSLKDIEKVFYSNFYNFLSRYFKEE